MNTDTTGAAKRVTFTRRMEQDDYADARYDVLLDGEKIGEVSRTRETTVVPYAGVNYGRPVTRTTWTAETLPSYRPRLGYTDSRTRTDAVADLIVHLGLVEGDYATRLHNARKLAKGQS